MKDAANPGTPVVIAIAGLPGSGKSYFLELLKTDDPALFVDHDFLKESGDGMCINAPGLSSLVKFLQSGHHAAIADIHFTVAQKRIEFEAVIAARVPAVKIVWSFFEGDPVQCEANLLALAASQDVTHRLAALKRFQQLYRIPDEAKTIPVYRPSR